MIKKCKMNPRWWGCEDCIAKVVAFDKGYGKGAKFTMSKILSGTISLVCIYGSWKVLSYSTRKLLTTYGDLTWAILRGDH